MTLNKTSATLEVGASETLSATVAPSDATNKTVTWTSSTPAAASVENGVITAVAPGSTIITAKSNNNKTATCEVTVTAKSVTITGVGAEDKAYDGTTAAAITGTAAVSGVAAGDDVSVVEGSAAFADANAGNGKTVTFTGFSLSGGDAEKYSLSGQPANVTANITKVPVTVSFTAADRPYEAGNTGVTVTGSVEGAVNNETLGVTAAGTVDENAGSAKTVTLSDITLTGSTAANYEISNTPAVKVTISAIDWTYTSAEGSAKYGANGSLAFGNYVAPGASVQGITTDNDAAFQTLPAYDSGSGDLTWKFAADAATGSSVHVTVPAAGATNYNDYEVAVTLTVLDKQAQNLSFSELAKTVKYGESYALAATAGVSDGGEITYSVDPVNSDVVELDAATGAVTALKPGSVTVVASAAATDDYAPATASYALTVEKRAVTVTPQNANVAVGGSLPDKTTLYTIGGDGFLDADAASIPIEVYYMEDEQSIEDSAVDLSTPGAYGILVYVDLATNSMYEYYEVSTGENATLTIAVPQPSAPDYGSGESTTTATDSEGNTTTTTTSADGSSTSVVTDSEGNVTAVEASVSQDAVAAAADGGAVAIAMDEIAAADSAEEAVAISVSVPESAGVVDVEIPVEDAGPGVVVYMKNADGEYELVKDCTVTEDGVVVGVEGDAELVVIDNTKEFSDVDEDGWAADAITFVTAREIFNGTGTSTFSPKASMNRGMVAQVLFNLDKDAEAGDSTGFSDVAEGARYADAIGWAADEGLVNGYADGTFDAEAPVTREQLVTILYRYAQSKGKGLTGAWMFQLDFEDAGDVSSYADEAMHWAVANGIINGKNGLLDPQGEATREQVAAVIERFVKLR